MGECRCLMMKFPMQYGSWLVIPECSKDPPNGQPDAERGERSVSKGLPILRPCCVPWLRVLTCPTTECHGCASWLSIPRMLHANLTLRSRQDARAPTLRFASGGTLGRGRFAHVGRNRFASGVSGAIASRSTSGASASRRRCFAALRVP